MTDLSAMSALLNSSVNGSSSNLTESSGRSFTTSFSGQSNAASPAFHHTGVLQGMHHYGSYNVPNMPGTLASRTTTLNNVPPGGVQQSVGNIAGGRISQISHGNSHVHSGLTNRGGLSVVGNPGYNSSTNGVGSSIPGILPTSGSISNRNSVQGLGVSPMLGNTGQRITNSGGGNVGRSISSGGGLSMPGLASRMNLNSNNGSGNVNVQGQNRLMGGVLQQASPQVISMLGNSYGAPLSQNHVQGLNNMNSIGMLNDVNSNDGVPFDINDDFPQLSSRPNSSGGPRGQIGSLRKQGLNSMVQQNQDFSIQNEDFPALPGFKGGSAEYSMDLQQKEQLHDSTASMMQQAQQFSLGRSSGFNLGGTFSSHRQQQPQQHTPSMNMSNQELTHLHGSDVFSSTHSSYHQQGNVHPSIGLRPLNSPNSVSSIGSYDQLIQQYQQHQNQPPQFRLQPFREQGIKNIQTSATIPDRFGLLGLLNVIRMSDPDLTSLALGIDLTTLGLNLNSTENLYKTFGSPWSDEPVKGDPEFAVPPCYYTNPPPSLNQAYFSRFQLDTLFYIYYSMPKEEAQVFAANELYNRGWFYHKIHKLWFMRVANSELLAKSNLHERGSYICFDPNTWETIRKDNFVIQYEALEKRPNLGQQH